MTEDQQVGEPTAPRPSEGGASSLSKKLWLAVAGVVLVAVVAAVLLLRGGDDGGSSDSGSGAGSGSGSGSTSTAAGGAAAGGRGAGACDATTAAASRSLDGVDYPSATVRITSAGGEVKQACVMLADTPIRRQHGLMGVTEFAPHVGMVFVQQADTAGAFWMYNTPTPLSIAWFASDGTFVSAKDMEPCASDPHCPTYPPGGLYRYALEVPKGKLGDYGVGPGSKLEVLPAQG
jgi:hypothetical protein